MNLRFLALAVAAACTGAPDDPDLDGDGSPASEDCDDGDATRHPGATERCDGIDNDCDGEVDEASAVDVTVWHRDLDNDGYGVDEPTLLACTPPEGWADNADDCDDADPLAWTTASDEVCDDGADNNCNGSDDGCSASGAFDGDTATLVILGGEGEGLAEGLSAGDPDGDGIVDVILVGTDVARSVEGPITGRVDASDAPSFSGVTLSAAAAGGRAVAFGSSIDSSTGSGQGAVYLVLGGLTGDVSASEADGRVAGRDGDNAGASLAWIGDATGDGLDDLVVGAPRSSTGTALGGAAYLVDDLAVTSLEDVAPWTGAAASDRAGLSVAGVGDVDGDGYADFVVGADLADPGGPTGGAAYLVLGTGGGTLADAALVVTGSAGSNLGAAVSGAGDVDGDGTPDLLVAAPGYADGAAFVFDGTGRGTVAARDAWAVITGDVRDGGTGAAVAGGEDLDLDGFTDVVVAAPTIDDIGRDSGVAALHFGLTAGPWVFSDAQVVVHGTNRDHRAGSSLGLADLTGDGIADLLVGIPGYDRRGAVVVVPGGGY